MARNVVRMPLPASIASHVRPNPGSDRGEPLAAGVLSFMQARFRTDLGAVRVHTGPQAAQRSRELGARAFTVGQDIYFGEGRYQPETAGGLELIAHEVTHTVQQRDGLVRVQRLGLDDILDGLAELAANVPGFTLLTLIIGRNPINLRVVERTLVNLLRGFMGLVPGGEVLFQVLERYGVVTRLGHWIDEQTRNAGLSFAGIREAFTRFTDSLGWSDIFSPGDVWRRARDIFGPPLARLRDIAAGLVSQAIAWLKETFMQPLADFCREIPGYGLVTVMLGRDPFTNAPVARTPLNVVRAVAEFIPGGTEKVNQLVESHALERAYNWFMEETRARNLTWERVTGTFAAAWNSLQLEDVLHPIDTLQRTVNLFRPLLSDLAGFARAALMKLAELIFEAVMGAVGNRIVAIFRRARATFNLIIADPVRFVRNLLAAIAQGVRQFMANILTHLRDGVIAWLTGPVARAGIQMPERWDLRGIIWFVLQILGLTWARVREKLVRLMGERAVALLEAGFQLLVEIREKGLVQALRDRVTEFFGNLREAALGAIRSFIQQRLVMAGIQQLLSMLSPVGAVIQAIIKIYTTIQFFLQKINEILDVVESIVNSIAAIAAGAIAAAANFVERTMARTIPVVLDFLARFIGLGDVGSQVQSTIRGIQASVDRMLDRAVDWIKNQARNLVSRALGGDPNATPEQRLQRGVSEGQAAVNRLPGSIIGRALITPVLAAIRARHALRSLDVEAENGRWVVVGEVNPRLRGPTAKLAQTGLGVAGSAFKSRISFAALRSLTHKGVTLRVGARMTADPVGPDLIGTGSTVSDGARGDLRGLIGARQSSYRVGHLLNHHIGGSGSDWQNLTPLSASGNALHFNRVEDDVRTIVEKGTGQNRWVFYDVVPRYGSHPSIPAAAHPAEALFARELDIQWQPMVPDPNKPTQLQRSGSLVREHVTNTLPT